MNQIKVKVIASFNESAEVQPLYMKFRYQDEDLTFKIVYSREIPGDDFYINSKKLYKVIAELNSKLNDHRYEFTLTYSCRLSLWMIDEKQLNGI